MFQTGKDCQHQLRHIEPASYFYILYSLKLKPLDTMLRAVMPFISCRN